MIIVMKPKASQQSIHAVTNYIENSGLQVHLSQGEEVTIIGIVGDKTRISTENLIIFKDVDRIVPVTESYKLSNRKFHPDATVVKVGNTTIGPGNLTIMAGPCAVETKEQLLEIAKAVKASGATILRGGAYKPRTSPYSFQGLEEEGLRYMQEAKAQTGLSTICEVVSLEAIEAAVKYVDMIQIGARNMQNFELLKRLGKLDKPILLKRGLANTIEELLMSAEYIMAEGNEQVLLCERGIRTYETMTRNTLDISAVPVLKRLSHLPVIVDPSHASGINWLIEPLAIAAAAVGADGLIIEVHNDPSHALCDGAQSITPDQFDSLAKKVNTVFGTVHSL